VNTAADERQPAPTSGVAGRVARGSFWSLGGQIVTLGASLVATPFVIRLLGPDSYGALALINLILAYFAFSDFGMAIASTKFGAEAYARGDPDGEAAVIWTSLMWAFFPSALLSGMLALFAPQILVNLLHVGPELRAPAILGVRIGCIAIVARSLYGVMNTPQLIRLRMGLYTSITVGTNLLQVILVPVMLRLGGGLVGATIVIAATATLALVLHTVASIWLLPSLLHFRVRAGLSRPMLVFGLHLVVVNLASVVLTNAEKLVLTRMVSVHALAFYAVQYTLAALLMNAPTAISQSLLPAFSRLQGEDKRQELGDLYRQALRLALLWLPPALLIVVVGAKPFLRVWAGAEYAEQSIAPLLVLLLGIAFYIVGNNAYLLLVACGRSNLVATFYVLEIVPYLAAATLATHFAQATGAAAAWSLRAIVDALFMLHAARKRLGALDGPLRAHRAAYGAALALLMPAALVWLLSASLLIDAAAVAASVAGYVYIVWWRVLSPKERSWLAGGLRRLVPGQR
jgi:O-antigen/teichoic acid export membrane protein